MVRRVEMDGGEANRSDGGDGDGDVEVGDRRKGEREWKEGGRDGDGDEGEAKR